MKRFYKPDFTYQDFAPQFTAEFFNATAWAELFRRSGAKYVVLTTKHHEGFTLWPSRYSANWNSLDIGPKKDIVGEVAAAVRASGLRFGTYHSLMEWFHPLYMKEKATNWSTDEFVRLKIRPEMEELVTTYQPDIFWSDGDAEAPDSYWKSADFLAWLYNESPVKDKVVVNDRWGIGTAQRHGGFYVGPDRFNPGHRLVHKWENAMTIDSQSWGFRREAVLSDYFTIEDLLGELASTVSCGGNLLINVGPTGDGRIIPLFEERLHQLGDWLAVNGEAIYGSQPFSRCQNDTISKGVWYTQQEEPGNKTTVYGISLKWPESGAIEFGCIKPSEVKSVQLLGTGDGTKVFTEKGLVGTVVHFPLWSPLMKAKYAYTFKFSLL